MANTDITTAVTALVALAMNDDTAARSTLSALAIEDLRTLSALTVRLTNTITHVVLDKRRAAA